MYCDSICRGGYRIFQKEGFIETRDTKSRGGGGGCCLLQARYEKRGCCPALRARYKKRGGGGLLSRRASPTPPPPLYPPLIWPPLATDPDFSSCGLDRDDSCHRSIQIELQRAKCRREEAYSQAFTYTK